MGGCRIFGITSLLFVLTFGLYNCACAAESEWRVYHSDEIAIHYYKFNDIETLSESAVMVRVKVIPKNGDKRSLKDMYDKDFCEVRDFAKVIEIECSIEMDCQNRTYRVTGGLFSKGLEIAICEPRRERLKWVNIPFDSPIDRLFTIVCPKGGK